MVAAFVPALAWLTFVVVVAQRETPEFRELLAGLGGPLPHLTTALFVSYRWWWLAPAVLAVLGVDVLRRSAPSWWRFAVVLSSTIVASLLLLAWLYAALSRPMTAILEAVD